MIVYSGTNEDILKSIGIANEFFDKHLASAVMSKEKFEFTTADREQIIRVIKDHWVNNLVSVRLYRSFWPWTKTLAYTTNSKQMNLNTRKLDRSIASIVGTIVHEFVHCADKSSYYNFGHGNNSSHGKDDSVPYYLGNYAKSWVLQDLNF